MNKNITEIIEKQTIGSRHLVITYEILTDDNLNLAESVLLAKIENYHYQKGCYATDEHLKLGICKEERHFRKLIKSLEDKGYITREKYANNGRRRIIKMLKRKRNKRAAINKNNKGENHPITAGENHPITAGENHPTNNKIIEREYNKVKKESKTNNTVQISKYWNLNEQLNREYNLPMENLPKDKNGEPRRHATTLELLENLTGELKGDKHWYYLYQAGIKHTDVIKAINEVKKSKTKYEKTRVYNILSNLVNNKKIRPRKA